MNTWFGLFRIKVDTILNLESLERPCKAPSSSSNVHNLWSTISICDFFTYLFIFAFSSKLNYLFNGILFFRYGDICTKLCSNFLNTPHRFFISLFWLFFVSSLTSHFITFKYPCSSGFSLWLPSQLSLYPSQGTQFYLLVLLTPNYFLFAWFNSKSGFNPKTQYIQSYE